jgi:hypothetical protein
MATAMMIIVVTAFGQTDITAKFTDANFKTFDFSI